MFRTVFSAAVFGVESKMVCVEADVGAGLPSFSMVGYLSAQVKEAQERVRTALKNAGFRMEPKRVTVNLSPADLKKSGTGFDLPIAIAIAAAYGAIPQERLDGILIAGELSLNGEVQAIPGILPIVAGAAQNGCKICMVPKANEQEGAVLEGIRVIGTENLKEAIDYLQGNREIAPACAQTDPPAPLFAAEDFADISGQEAAKRALEVAVCGFHNLLMTGPPGAGKSMLAKRIPGILPPMTIEEAMEVSRIYSVSGLLREKQPLLCSRPFRSPHHTATAKAMAGGGMVPKPGEVSLAHNGVLFLDELPEFSRDALEILRQPMEDGEVFLSRAGVTYRFPADFMLVAAMNPCPCGYYPDLSRCTCTPPMVRRYLQKISSPLLERIDITVEVEAVRYPALEKTEGAERSARIRERVLRCRAIQQERYQNTPYRFNSNLDRAGLETYCALERQEKEYMGLAFEKLGLSARTYYRILKVARTIADMDGGGRIRTPHLQEALCYRSIHKKYWQNRQENAR